MKELALTITRPVVWLYNKTHWFTDREAWGIYRFFAIGEAAGWTLLITAIVYRRLGLPEAASVISFAGHIHGILFLLYFLMTLLAARSMGWGIIRVGLAIIAGMPPYGSVVFEQIMARYRKRKPEVIAPPVGVDE
jgi:integral membrane protein